VAFGVDEGVALNAFSLLARIIADRINGDPPFSVAFATCVSMIDAVGSPSRPGDISPARFDKYDPARRSASIPRNNDKPSYVEEHLLVVAATGNPCDLHSGLH